MSHAGTWTSRTTSLLPRPAGSATVRAHVETGRCPSVRALRSGSCSRRGWVVVGATRHARTRWSAAPPRTIGRPRRRTSLIVLAIPRPANDWMTTVTASPCCLSLKTPSSLRASNTQSPFPGCRAGTASSQARFAAHRPPPSNSFHPQLHNPPIAAHHLFLSSLSQPDEGNRKIAGRPYQAHWRSASPVTTPFRPPSLPTNGTNRTTVSS
jgi:hypothetical protein